jgi:hypothetical protein
MVIVKLIGGLGNQMFQYATGRRLAHRLGTQLKLDVSDFEIYKLRSYNLDIFDLVGEFATTAEVAWLKFGKASRIKKLWLLIKQGRSGPSYIQEKHFHLNPGVLTLHDNVYLDGYWQSEAYFKDIEDVIRNDFKLRAPPSEENSRLADRIDSVCPVSLHIRRGDYVSDPTTNRVHGTLDPDYYERSMDLIAAKITNPHFFIFSDDPGWGKMNLAMKHGRTVSIIDNNDEAHAHEDFRLMSRCKHHVIANSSFSWWAAWLNPYPEKIVIAPKKWFNDPSIDTSDLIPESWLRI